MALLFLKNLLFPRTRTHNIGDGERQKLLASNDLERQLSPLEDASECSQDTLPSNATAYDFLRQRIDPRVISDATIGLSDGLTVPFALMAGLSALGTTQLVIYAGFAELVAGAISMGLGGYLGAKAEADAYYATLEDTKGVVRDDELKVYEMIKTTFHAYGLREETINLMVENLRAEGDAKMVAFVMRFPLQLTESDCEAHRAYLSGLTIALGYFMGGLVPLLPFVCFTHVRDALYCTVVVTAFTLFVFGWVKTSLVGESSHWVCFQNAVQMLLLGGLAAGSAMVCVRLIGR